MSVIDLKTRLTNDQGIYHANVKSAKSYIYISGSNIENKLDDSLSVDLTVGKKWYKSCDNRGYDLEQLKVKPGEAVIIETDEEIGVPYNTFGIIFGIGRNIFNGGYISLGKIKPGFFGKLKIGYHNTSKQTTVFKPGDKLISCTFFATEKTIDYPEKSKTIEPFTKKISGDRKFAVKLWIGNNWYKLLTLIFAFSAIVISVFSLFKK